MTAPRSSGPWRIDGGKVFDANDAYVGGIVFLCRADLALVLAAPELLAALKVAAIWTNPDTYDSPEQCEAHQQVLAAIAKAEGGTP